MSKITKESFEETIDALITAPAKSSAKGNKFKQWFQNCFGGTASIARINEDRQIGNRIVEQYSHNDSTVVFVCEPGVQRETVCRRIFEKFYAGLSAVLVVGAKKPYTYEHLYANAETRFVKWAVKVLGLSVEQFQNVSYQPSENFSRQLITYGAPGTGKSWGTDKWVKDNGIKCFRTTFHPDSDYSTFVGAYKPVAETVRRTALVGKKVELAEGAPDLLSEKRITYKFVAQAFIKAYVEAWKQRVSVVSGASVDASDGDADSALSAPPRVNNPVCLVIEEINRGNCAQIFGDLFQLLDRAGNGFSEYEINADEDLHQYLAEVFKGIDVADAKSKVPPAADKIEAILKGEVLLLPDNLYIHATMNTSDQSLFPIDSAFKRRWDWKYVPIAKPDDKDFTIEFDGHKYNWWKFLEKINPEIYNDTKSADKQLGFFFVNPGNGIIDLEMFVSKVCFYIWGDVFKDSIDEYKIFKGDDGKEIQFSMFYRSEDDKKKLVAKFLENLGVPDENAQQTTADAGDAAIAPVAGEQTETAEPAAE